MKIIEIFKSIDGEGVRTGLPVTFIRLAGCNLRCTYCDTKYSYENPVFTEMSVDEIIGKVYHYGVNAVTITGGEPLIHKDILKLVDALVLKGFEVNIETNGAVDVEEFDKKLSRRSVLYTIDHKSISSGMTHKMLLSNINFARKNGHAVKFVVGSKADLDQARHIVEYFELKNNVFFSPVFGEITPKEIVEYVLKYPTLKTCRVQVQLHKIIWDPNERGV